MERYSRIENKLKREIVLLKAKPCAWSKCTFCDYIADNSTCLKEMIAINQDVLKRVTGLYGVLEVIDSASIFELPQETLQQIKHIIQSKHIHTLLVESHWLYRHRIHQLRNDFQIPIIVKIGVETFDDHFRNDILNKNATFQSIEELKHYFDSPCLMVGIKGQTQEMIIKDINILEQHFQHGTISIYRNNSTPIKRDEQLIAWFMQQYAYLQDDPRFDVLFEPTDFGVGD